VAAAIVADGALLVGRQRAEALEDLDDGLVSPLGALEGGIGLVHVGLMVLVVVDPASSPRPIWRLERVVVGREGAETVYAISLLLFCS